MDLLAATTAVVSATACSSTNAMAPRYLLQHPATTSSPSSSSSSAWSASHSYSSRWGQSQQPRLKHNGQKQQHRARNLRAAAPTQHHVSVVRASAASAATSADTKADAAAAAAAPLRVMIAGAPASGKGTQCEYIVKKYGLVHISAGDLLRAEVAAGTPNGKLAQEYMDAGKLVPDDVVNNMVKDRLAAANAAGQGWLLDGFPRSASQAAALVAAGLHPDTFVLLQVPDDVIVERVAGRRLDPETGKIYHMTFFPPPNDPRVLKRLVQRSDDTEDKVKARLDTHAANVASVLDMYKDLIFEVDGNRDKDKVFSEIDELLTRLHKDKKSSKASSSSSSSPSSSSSQPPSSSSSSTWRGMPTRLNDTPHSREMRKYFYDDVCQAAQNAVANGQSRLRVDLLIPELNPEMDVYRIGTLLELMRELAFTFASKGKRVKVCVQGPMGSGIFTGMPLQLSGTRRMLEMMDWGKNDGDDAKSLARADLISIGAVGAKEVSAEDDIFLIMAPQNAPANCIIDDLQAMADAVGDRPFIIINPRLKDLPSASGVMQVSGRAERLEFTDTFASCYVMRLLYLSGTQYPILGSLRYAYPGPFEVYKREDITYGQEKYSLADTFPDPPTSADIANAFAGKKRSEQQAAPTGIWGFLSKILS